MLVELMSVRLIQAHKHAGGKEDPEPIHILRPGEVEPKPEPFAKLKSLMPRR